MSFAVTGGVIKYQQFAYKRLRNISKMIWLDKYVGVYAAAIINRSAVFCFKLRGSVNQQLLPHCHRLFCGCNQFPVCSGPMVHNI